MRSQPGEVRVAADDQSFTRKIGRGDRGHVAIVEQRHLQDAASGESLNVGRAQRGDPIKPSGPQLFVDARLRDHAAIADQHDMLQAEALFELVDLRAERVGIGGIAFKHFDRHRTAVRRAQQAVNDLQLALLAVAIVAAFGQLAAAPFDIARRHVVEHDCSIVQMLAGERFLEAGGEQGLEQVLESVLAPRGGQPNRLSAGRRGSCRSADSAFPSEG